jgi:hypothetical protein
VQLTGRVDAAELFDDALPSVLILPDSGSSSDRWWVAK